MNIIHSDIHDDLQIKYIQSLPIIIYILNAMIMVVSSTHLFPFTRAQKRHTLENDLNSRRRTSILHAIQMCYIIIDLYTAIYFITSCISSVCSSAKVISSDPVSSQLEAARASSIKLTTIVLHRVVRKI